MMQHDCRGPVDAAAVRRGYASVVPTAKIVLAEVANGLSFDRSAYEEQIDAELVERVANVLFAAGLAVACGEHQAFESYGDAHPDAEVIRLGASASDAVCWHHAPVAGLIIGAGYHEAEPSAREVVRRAAFNRCYRPIIETDEAA
jgi:hypothetical protein